MNKIYNITEHKCQIIENWIKYKDYPKSFDPSTIEGILNHWRRREEDFTFRQEKALLNIYNGFNLDKKKSKYEYDYNNSNENDICYACMNTGKQYYQEDIYGPCVDCDRGELCSHPSE